MDKVLFNVRSNYFGKAPVYNPPKINKPETPIQKTLDKLTKMK